MKQVTIVAKKNAGSFLSKIANINSLVYCLFDDYACFIELQDKFSNKIKIMNLRDLFQGVFDEIRIPLINLSSEINKKFNSFQWWGGQVASRSSSATPLLLHITYLFCAKRILSDLKDSNKNIIFIVDSFVLTDCIGNIAKFYGYKIVNCIPKLNKYTEIPYRWLCYAKQSYCFLYQAFQNRKAAFALLKPLTAKKSITKKRIVIRSWINKNTFTKFKDRNFGSLPEWLRAQGYEIWTMPMFFGQETKIKEIYVLMKDDARPFLIPEHYLKGRDYLAVLLSAFRLLRAKIKDVKIEGVDVAPIFNEVIKALGFNPYLLTLNLCSPALKRLKEKGYEIDGFYYPFENLAPEKQFILSCRKYYPSSKIVGFQHTTFYRDQLAHHLAPGEENFHPLPDKIICSGPIYIDLLKNAGFPSEILVLGSNLRFESVHMNIPKPNMASVKEKILMIAPPGLLNFDCSFLVKIKDALKINNGYVVYIRRNPAPAASKKLLTEFLEKIDMGKYRFADAGSIQEWLPTVRMVISGGISITILEAVSFGTPVIRVIPDNTFFLNPFIWPDYPLKPVSTPLEIIQQIQSIEKILDNDKEYFTKIGREVLTQYFTRPNEENLKVFL